jgi:hypothetical protein
VSIFTWLYGLTCAPPAIALLLAGAICALDPRPRCLAEWIILGVLAVALVVPAIWLVWSIEATLKHSCPIGIIGHAILAPFVGGYGVALGIYLIYVVAHLDLSSWRQ